MKDFEKQNNPTIPAKWWKNKRHEKSINFRIAEKEDIPALAKLYAICFGDDEAETEDFLHSFFPVSDFIILIAVREDMVISMLSMIPARLAKGADDFYRAFYLYGIGTLPAYRNQGLSQSLMDCAKSLAFSLNYDYLFLVPASEKLISFYEKQGFQTMPAAKAENLPAPFWDCSVLIPISSKEYLALRANLENTSGVFSLLEPFNSYALEIISEQLHFYRDMQSQCGLCFYDNKKKPPLQFLEQTGPSSRILNSLLHQVFPLGSCLVPDATYFQFPMDEL